MKIVDVSPFLLRGSETYGAHEGGEEATDQGDWLLLVRVLTDEGLEGWSDAETLGPVAARVISGQGMSALGFRTLSEQLIGRDPLDVEQLWEQLYISTAYYGRRGVAMQCISAVDNCLWSIRAQAGGISLADVLGGPKRDRIPAYASTLFRRTPDDNRAAAQRYVDLGFTGVKFGWGNFGVDGGRDEENVAAIREVIGEERHLMVDPGWYVESPDGPRLRTREQTHAMLGTLGGAAPYWVEDFVHPERLELYADYKRDFPKLRFAAGEQLATSWELRRLVEEGCIDVVQPDLSRCGGVTVAKSLATEGWAVGREIVTHSWLTDLLHAYSLHYLATLPNADWVEFNVAQSRISRGIVEHPMTLQSDGTLLVPTGSGVGVDVDSEFITAHRVAA